MKKHLMIATAITAISLGVITTSVVSADTATKQASKQSSTTHAKKQLRGHVRLNQAERDGTITAAQKTAFQTELKSLRAERKQAISSTSTKAERQAERAKLKTELKAWASSNNFPLAKIFPKLAS